MHPNSAEQFSSGAATNAPNPVDSHIGARIRALRLSLEIEQDALAELIGAAISDVQKYEFGESRITAERLLRISRILNVSVSLFFESPAVLATE